jgi:hypothetical protein
MDIRVNRIYFAEVLVNYSYLSYITINRALIKSLNLLYIRIRP